ncbi:hypothetical protein [Pueribacillus sp. YX66]
MQVERGLMEDKCDGRRMIPSTHAVLFRGLTGTRNRFAVPTYMDIHLIGD